MKISIVVPVYNSEKTIDRCVNSLVNQTERDVEIILVDDCSTDQTKQRLVEWSSKDNRIVCLFNENNVGTLMSRKKGVIQAQGEYIMFCDSDDWYESNACENLYRIIKKKSVDILLYGARGEQEGNHISNDRLIKYNRSLAVKEELHRGENCIFVANSVDRLWNKIIKTDVCKKAYTHAEDTYLTHAEDTYACWLIHYYANSLGTDTNIYYRHSLGSGLTSRKMTLDNYDKWCGYRRKCEDLLWGFVRRENCNVLIQDSINQKHKSWLKYCINCLINDIDSDMIKEGWLILCKYYSDMEVMETTFDMLKTERQKHEKAKKTIKKLNIKYNRIVNSKSYKVARHISSAVKLVSNNKEK